MKIQESIKNRQTYILSSVEIPGKYGPTSKSEVVVEYLDSEENIASLTFISKCRYASEKLWMAYVHSQHEIYKNWK